MMTMNLLAINSKLAAFIAMSCRPCLALQWNTATHIFPIFIMF